MTATGTIKGKCKGKDPAQPKRSNNPIGQQKESTPVSSLEKFRPTPPPACTAPSTPNKRCSGSSRSDDSQKFRLPSHRAVTPPKTPMVRRIGLSQGARSTERESTPISKRDADEMLALEGKGKTVAMQIPVLGKRLAEQAKKLLHSELMA